VIAPGTPLVLRGRAVDDRDGVAPCEELVWDVRLGHNAHAHPWRTDTGCEVTFGAALPGSHAGSSGLFLAVELRYTDHGGPNDAAPLTGRDSIRLELP
jgi:hypothetical protein